MAMASGLLRVGPVLTHNPAGQSLCFPIARRINVSASYSLNSSVTGSSTPPLLRCECLALGLPTLPSPFGSVRAWQQQTSAFLSPNPLNLSVKRMNALRKSGVVTKAGMRLDPGGGGGNEDGNGIGRVIVNLALAGGLTYLTVTGKLGWVFDTIISLWLLAALLPIVGVIAFLWFAEREIVTGACPNCGESFQVFEFAVKEEPQMCPYCSQPFKLENGRFIRDEPRFSSGRTSSGPFSGGFKSPFGAGFGRDTTTSSREDGSQEPGGIIVDVEAEVRDRD